MEMTEVFDRLKNLQEILAEKYNLEQKIEESPKQLESQDGLLARLKKEYIEKNSSYEEIKATVEKLKEELKAAETSREIGEKNMDNITTHREYEALDKQITEATEKEAAVRKDLVREEKKLSDFNEALRADEAMISSQEEDLNKSKENLYKQIADYKAQVSDLNAKETEITSGLDQEIVYKFQRIIKRNSEGIVAVKNGVCKGCNMILPAQFANEVREGDKILFCPYCSRVLFYQEALADEAEDYSTLDETGSLAGLYDDYADEYEGDEEGEERDEDSELNDDKSSINFED